ILKVWYNELTKQICKGSDSWQATEKPEDRFIDVQAMTVGRQRKNLKIK
ncbi:hypothetical protein HMPREF9094_2371, partial [Fusobacterium animalis ATCC 51191]